MEKEPWDSSDEKASEITFSMFGTPKDVCEKAEMPRRALNFDEAKKILGEITDKPLASAGGLVASISRNSAKELLSGKAVENSFEKPAHLLAAANADKLFSNAIESWDFDLNPEKSNEGLRALRRLYSPMLYDGRVVLVKMTVKEMKNRNEGSRLYSLKVINANLAKN